MGSLGLFTQNIIAMFSSFYIDALILKFGKRNVFLLSTVSFIVSYARYRVVNRTVLGVFVIGILFHLLTNDSSTILERQHYI